MLASTRGTSLAMQQRAGIRAFAPARQCTTRVQAKLSMAKVVESIAEGQKKAAVPTIRVGDTVKVGVAVQEGGGKTRTQTLEGTIIAEHGTGTNRTFTFRRLFQGVGIELIIPVHAPVLQKVDVVKSGRVRRAKLFYLRERQGKSARLREIVGSRKVTPQ